MRVLVVGRGVGIHEEDLKKLLMLNGAISKVETKNETLAGSALVFCYNSIKLHNGDLWIERILVKGPTFRFNFSKS